MDMLSTTNGMSPAEDARIVRIGDDRIDFTFLTRRADPRRLSLPIGIKTIASKYFVHTVPSEAEVEYAINHIEDELMGDTALVCQNETLYCEDAFMIDLAQAPKGPTTVVSREALEEMFTKYALVSMGRSPVYDDIAMDKEKYAGLLIVREIMHHLDFPELRIVNE